MPILHGRLSLAVAGLPENVSWIAVRDAEQFLGDIGGNRHGDVNSGLRPAGHYAGEFLGGVLLNLGALKANGIPDREPAVSHASDERPNPGGLGGVRKLFGNGAEKFFELLVRKRQRRSLRGLDG